MPVFFFFFQIHDCNFLLRSSSTSKRGGHWPQLAGEGLQCFESPLLDLPSLPLLLSSGAVCTLLMHHDWETAQHDCDWHLLLGWNTSAVTLSMEWTMLSAKREREAKGERAREAWGWRSLDFQSYIIVIFRYRYIFCTLRLACKETDFHTGFSYICLLDTLPTWPLHRFRIKR